MAGKKTMSSAVSFGLLWLRVLAGLGIASHGWQKIAGGFMPKFITGVAEMGFPMPELFAWAAVLSELVGGALLVLGLGTRVASLAVFVTMSVAVFIHHAHDPMKVKELALAYWTMSGALLLMGGGRYSLGSLVKKKTPSGR